MAAVGGGSEKDKKRLKNFSFLFLFPSSSLSLSFLNCELHVSPAQRISRTSLRSRNLISTSGMYNNFDCSFLPRVICAVMIFMRNSKEI